MTNHEQQLQRVYTKLEPIIRNFQLVHPEPFTMATLNEYVARFHPYTAPDSARRCLSKMKELKVVNYYVPKRGKGLYVWLALGEDAPSPADDDPQAKLL